MPVTRGELPPSFPVPPSAMPLLRGTRPLKRWRYVGVFSPGLMLSVADVAIGPLRQRFFAIARPGLPVLGRTVLGSRGLSIAGSSVRVRSGDVAIDLELDEDGGVESVHENGDHYVWTRKQAGIRARGSVTAGGDSHTVDAHAVVDDTAGYHARHTTWRWSAGVGTAADGRAVAWNLVSGVNDEPAASERTIWLDRTPAEAPPVSFAGDLTSIAFAGGETLAFEQWGAHEARRNLLLLRSAYRQPFGEFSGTLPGGIRLAAGLGVMEWHDVHW